MGRPEDTRLIEPAAIDRLLTRAHDADDLEDFGRIVARGILDLIPGISASYNEVNPMARRAFAVIEPEPEPGWWSQYQPVFEAHMTDNPALAHMMATGDTRARTWCDVGDVARFRTSELYRRFYRPLGIESQLAMLLPTPASVVIGVAVNRGEEGFDDGDRRLLDRLGPHLSRSYRHVQLRAQHRVLRDVMADDGWAVLLVQADGTIAAPIDGDLAGLRVGDDLPEPLRRSFLHAVRRPGPISAPAVAHAPVRLDVGPEPLVAAVLPSAVPPHVVLIRSARPLDTEHLRSFGLTPRQAAVAQGIVQGLSNHDIADRLGTRPATVKKHLEAIYRTLGVHNRAAAVARLSGHAG